MFKKFLNYVGCKNDNTFTSIREFLKFNEWIEFSKWCVSDV